MFFYNPFKGLKDLPKKNLKQLSIVMSIGLLSILLLLLALVLI